MREQDYSSLRQLVLEQAVRAYKLGLFAGTSGNLSAAGAGRGVVAITPSGVGYEGMTADDIVLVSPDGEVLSAREGRKPSSEMPLHLEIYRAKAEVFGIVHTHSPYATAYAAAGRAVPCALIEMAAFLGGDIPVAPLAMPGTREVGLGALEALKGRGGCLLANHGALAVGKSLEQALLRAEYIEDAAKICAVAQSLGGAIELDEGVIEKVRG